MAHLCPHWPKQNSNKAMPGEARTDEQQASLQNDENQTRVLEAALNAKRRRTE